MDPSDSNDRQMLRLQIRRRAIQSRLLMVFAIASTAMLTCCCVPMIVIRIAFGPEEFEKPAEVLAIAQEIAPMELPPRFIGAKASTADNSGLLLRTARFDQDQGRGRLLIGQMHFKMKSPLLTAEDIGKMEEQWLQSLMSELYPGLRNLNVKVTRTKKITLHGTEATFTIDEGEDLGSSTRRRQVTGTAMTSNGTIQLVMQVEDAFLTDDAIDAMLDSLADRPDKPTP